MSFFKKILYCILTVLTLAVLGTLLAWTVTRKDVVLIVSSSLSVVFIAYFFFLIYYNKRTGWRDEKTVRGRILGDEKMTLQVYFRDEKRTRLVAAAYLTDGQQFYNFLKNSADHSDMGMFDDVYIGYAILSIKEFASSRRKTVVLEKEVYEALAKQSELKEFISKNTFLYD